MGLKQNDRVRITMSVRDGWSSGAISGLHNERGTVTQVGDAPAHEQHLVMYEVKLDRARKAWASGQKDPVTEFWLEGRFLEEVAR